LMRLSSLLSKLQSKIPVGILANLATPRAQADWLQQKEHNVQ